VAAPEKQGVQTSQIVSRRQVSPVAASARRSLGAVVQLVVLVAVVALVHGFALAGGMWTSAPPFGGFYEWLGDSFASGRLSLEVEPPPGLLQLDNPYDPVKNAPYRLHDVSLYDGKYYVYWGPFPAIVHAIWLTVTGQTLSSMYSMAFFQVVSGLVFWLTLWRIQQAHFPTVSTWAVTLLTLGFSLSPTMFYLSGRPIHYHEAPVVAISCLVVSWLFLVQSWTSASTRRTLTYLLLSGTALGLSMASRMPFAAYAVVPAVVRGFRVLDAVRRRRPASLPLAQALAFGGPLALILVMLLVYNALRFDSPLEFGLRYILQGSPDFYDLVRRPDNTLGSQLLVDAIPKGAATYLLSVPVVEPLAPYIVETYVWPPPLNDLVHEGAFGVEAGTMSVLLIAPVTWFIGALSFAGVRREIDARPVVKLLVLSGLIGGLLALIPLCATPGVVVRYTADFVPGLTLAGSLVFMAVMHVVGRRRLTARQAPPLKVGALALSMFLPVMVVFVVATGLVVGVMSWRPQYPAAAEHVHWITDEMIAQATVTIWPSSAKTMVQPCGRSTWRLHDGSYRNEATIYLRAPANRPSLVALIDEMRNAPAIPGKSVVVKVAGQTVAHELLTDERLRIVARRLPDVEEGDIVPIQFQWSGATTPPPHTPVPIIMAGAMLTTDNNDRAARTLANPRSGCRS
jgi:hypothetical protein